MSQKTIRGRLQRNRLRQEPGKEFAQVDGTVVIPASDSATF
ncbi:MAG TPA: hypothetical protein VKP13_18945 [Nitrospira sp.]|nr:hypothetical protein [Nitrospira sp.]